jgi:hypothetical protein
VPSSCIIQIAQTGLRGDAIYSSQLSAIS